MNSALDSTDRGKDLSREHWHWDHSLLVQDSIRFLEGLNVYSCLKYLASPPIQMDSFELKSRGKGTEILTQIFQAKYYLAGPKIILMALSSCKLIIRYSLPFDNHFTEKVVFHTNCATLVWWTRCESHPHFILHWKLS